MYLDGSPQAGAKRRLVWLSVDRLVHRETLRPLAVSLILIGLVDFVASLTPIPSLWLGQPSATILALLAPPLFGAGVWLRSGRPVRAAISWALPTFLVSIVAMGVADPARSGLLLAAATFWVSMMTVSRAINWWEARVARTAAYGRLDRPEEQYDSALEDILVDALAYGSQFERLRIGRSELVRAHRAALNRLSARPAPTPEWAEVRQELSAFIKALISADDAAPGSSREEIARAMASSRLESYRNRRAAVRDARLRQWHGFELFA